jgi:hypothetical protein
MKNRKGNQTKNAWKVGESRDHIFRDRKTRNLKRKGEGKLQGIPYFFFPNHCVKCSNNPISC